MAELSAFKPHDREIEIVNPGTKLPMGITVTIMSGEDDRMKQARRNLRDAKLRADQRNKILTSQEQEENRNLFLQAGMTGWTWGKDADGEQNTFHGEVPDFTPKNVRDVFAELPWFPEQIDNEMGDTARFFTS